MIDILDIEWLDPVMIWKAAADKDPTALAAYLRSGKALSEWDRAAIAMLIEGKLTPPKRPGHRPAKTEYGGAFRELYMTPLDRAVRHYFAVKNGRFSGRVPYGKQEPIIQELARQHDVSDEQLGDRIKKYRKPGANEPMPSKVSETADGIAQEFHAWCRWWGRFRE